MKYSRFFTNRSARLKLIMLAFVATPLLACSGDDGETGGDNGDKSGDLDGGSAASTGGTSSATGGTSNGSGGATASGANSASGGQDGDGTGGADSTVAVLVAETGRLAGFTAAHNAVRAEASAGIPDLVWDEEIAGVAQAYAEKLAVDCDFMHSGGIYGENLAANWGSENSAQGVVDGWSSEKSDYNYSDNSCSGVCGHYTQIVWAQSTQLGCGMATCADGGEIWVCNYNPPGNFVGEKPY